MKIFKTGRGEGIARCAAAGLALLLVLVYFLLPMENAESFFNNSGREKMTLEPGKAYSWSWIPENDHLIGISLKLSGVGKLQDTALNIQILDEQGAVLAEKKAEASDFKEEGNTIQIDGNFEKGSHYVLIIWTEGDQSVRLRGMKPEDGGELYPMIQENCQETIYNPVLIYFAAGALMAALTPVYGTAKKTLRRRRRKGDASLPEKILPWAAFALIAGLGIFLAVKKPAPTFAAGEDIWIGSSEDIHWANIEKMNLWNPDGIRYAFGNAAALLPGYIPALIGYYLMRFFTADINLLYHASVISQILAFAALSFFAVKHAPRYKAVFLTAAAMPGVISLMTGITFEMTVIGSILLGTALAMEAADGKEITSLRAIFMVCLMAFGTVAKPAYSLALLVLMIIPRERFGSARKAWVFRGFVILMLIWCLAALIIPGYYDNMPEGDNILAGRDGAGQIANMQEFPWTEGLYPLRHMWENQKHLMIDGISEWHGQGTSETLNILYLILMLLLAPLCTVGEDPDQIRPLGWRRRIGFLAIALGAETILAYLQFIFFSEVSGEITGLQARFILPVWILIALALTRTKWLRQLTGSIGKWISVPAFLSCAAINAIRAAEMLQMLGRL